MLFSSPTFLLFFAVLLLFYAGARSYRERAAIVLAGSLLFYASWKPAYLLLLTASVSLNYWLYSALSATRSKRLLVAGLALNLGFLGIIKYLGMALDTLSGLAGWLELPVPAAPPAWVHWALPLGISFYTFHMLSVMIDVYRGEWTHRISFRAWWMYVTFFPHMIAGPILRASELVEQLEDLQPLRAREVKLGALIFLAGLVKKVLFADNLAPLADALFGQPQALGLYAAWLAATAFALQIYFDFSGYSEMAVGLARMFGVVLPRNFLHPYTSRSVREFWQRWHITLSRWLRDYLYISLGGNRRGKARNLANLMITMLLGGLWHGAAWTFVFWGLLHGSYLVLHRVLLDACTRVGVLEGSAAARALSWLGWPVTLALVWLTWVFFRAPTFHDAWTITAAMLGMADAAGAPAVRTYVQALVWASLLLVLVEPAIERALKRGLRRWGELHFTLRGTAYAGIALMVILFGGSSQKFIYFDF
ncbi:MBOAT family O-acyltransferase [Thiobacillus sedimenti]|uniref:Probable alginate O-acetylase AlgI n=1 Tax=Thiobacillus sedimenti TaxID=3110231 RepID=A0ABZ1CJR7_9PROT|nr:MBOAT family O-acyltransferase [Thiobacillus sp. SCUT-2]WRS39628.1 MBOAT family O-acyltransferase [Thiobacillus sp. SCUT-2]